MSRHLLITGGAGYVGSHACVQLLGAGYEVTVFDNFTEASVDSIRRIRTIAGREFEVVEGDLLDVASLAAVFASRGISAVLHFAALKSPDESVRAPLAYYSNNVGGTINLLNAMASAGVSNLVFSSSAAVYGPQELLPTPVTAHCNPTTPYGRSKLAIEQLLEDLARADERWKILCLRYFNPVGAHPSGLLGESPARPPTNIMPLLCAVAAGRRPSLSVFGSDFPTPDGSALRDYVHVMDVADAHRAALEYLESGESVGFAKLNIGTGSATSVLQLISTFEASTGQRIDFRIERPRPGEVAASLADPRATHSLLNWRTSRTLREMCADAWRWDVQRLVRSGY